MAISGTVFNIQRYAIHDGPGVRTTVFLKGCPLSCPWCHNPEGISPRPDLVHREARCRRCGECVDACPTGALTWLEGRLSISDDRCDRCGRCEDVCASGALEIMGREMTVDQVVAEIERDTIFYDESGGGATFSGGEPFRQPRFLRQLLRACREREIHTVVDTSGYVPPEVVRSVEGLVDLFLVDLKLVDPHRHREWTGVDNGPILENLRWLALNGEAVNLRVPIIPTVNDDEENLRAIAEVAGSLPTCRGVDILPYHGIAADKYRRLRQEYRLPHLQSPSGERMAEIASLLEGYGLTVNIGG